jgi:hypothetical protein
MALAALQQIGFAYFNNEDEDKNKMEVDEGK